jgi:hypothetical protein
LAMNGPSTFFSRTAVDLGIVQSLFAIARVRAHSSPQRFQA